MRTTRRIIAVGVLTGIAALGFAGCSTEARAERKGKQFGDEVCKIKRSDNTDEAQRHLRKAQDKLDDLARFVGRDVREDARTLERNLDQIARDFSRSGDVRDRDVNAIIRSIDDARSSASGAGKAAYDGVVEALNDCN